MVFGQRLKKAGANFMSGLKKASSFLKGAVRKGFSTADRASSFLDQGLSKANELLASDELKKAKALLADVAGMTGERGAKAQKLLDKGLGKLQDGLDKAQGYKGQYDEKLNLQSVKDVRQMLGAGMPNYLRMMAGKGYSNMDKFRGQDIERAINMGRRFHLA